MLIGWLKSLEDAEIHLPVHVGVCGPSNPQTLLKYAVSCGVGNSLKVLRGQLRNVWTFAKPYVPTDFVSDVAVAVPALRNFAGFHVFPFGGIEKTIGWMKGADAAAWG